MLTAELAGSFARLVLGHVGREYPNKLEHVINGPGDIQSPRQLHPVFYGSFDWHSCVHGYWLLVRVLRRFPELPEAAAITSLLNTQFTREHIAGEIAYLDQPNRATFERPYGWGWLLMLAGELARLKSADGRRWAILMEPLADAFVKRFQEFLPKATYPIRTGTHFNTAFACALAFDYADAAGNSQLALLLRLKVTGWYGADEACQAWEPGGDEFLSPALMEAECMRRALAPEEFTRWLDRFLPRIAAGEPHSLFVPATVSDRTDGKIAHLDGLNLSRAWCWRLIAGALDADDARKEVALASYTRHLEAALSRVSGSYEGEHWLATFALLALDG